MANNYSPEQIQKYQEYLQKFQGSQQAKQEAGPKPFEPAENQDKQKLASQKISPDMQSRAPAENRGALSEAADALRPYADMATAAAGGVVKGATGGMASINYPGMQDAMAAHPDASGDSALVGAGISSLIGGKALGGLGGMAKAAIASKFPGIGRLLKGVMEAAPETSAPTATAAQTASEVGEGMAQSAPKTMDPSSPTLRDLFKTRSRGQ